MDSIVINLKKDMINIRLFQPKVGKVFNVRKDREVFFNGTRTTPTSHKRFTRLYYRM